MFGRNKATSGELVKRSGEKCRPERALSEPEAIQSHSALRADRNSFENIQRIIPRLSDGNLLPPSSARWQAKLNSAAVITEGLQQASKKSTETIEKTDGDDTIAQLTDANRHNAGIASHAVPKDQKNFVNERDVCHVTLDVTEDLSSAVSRIDEDELSSQNCQNNLVDNKILTESMANPIDFQLSTFNITPLSPSNIAQFQPPPPPPPYSSLNITNKSNSSLTDCSVSNFNDKIQDNTTPAEMPLARMTTCVDRTTKNEGRRQKQLVKVNSDHVDGRSSKSNAASPLLNNSVPMSVTSSNQRSIDKSLLFTAGTPKLCGVLRNHPRVTVRRSLPEAFSAPSPERHVAFFNVAESPSPSAASHHRRTATVNGGRNQKITVSVTDDVHRADVVIDATDERIFVGDDTSLYGTSTTKDSCTSPKEPAPCDKSSTTYFLKDQIIAFFQPSDNKLAMKLFGNKNALDREKLRQKEAGNWVIHPCSNFR